MKTARQSLLERGDERTGWSLAWKINFWARFRDGNHAYNMLKLLFRPAISPEVTTGGGSYRAKRLIYFLLCRQISQLALSTVYAHKVALC